MVAKGGVPSQVRIRLREFRIQGPEQALGYGSHREEGKGVCKNRSEESGAMRSSAPRYGEAARMQKPCENLELLSIG